MIRGLLEVLKNTNDPNDTNINAAGLLESFKEHECSEWHEFLFIRLIRLIRVRFLKPRIRGLLEVLRNTNVPNDTNFYLFGWLSDSCSFSQNWICVLLEVLKNTNYPNDTKLCLFGRFEWFVFVFLWLDSGSTWITRNTNSSNDTNLCLFGWFEWFGVVFLRLDSGSFYFVVIWKKRVRRLPRLRSILSI